MLILLHCGIYYCNKSLRKTGLVHNLSLACKYQTWVEVDNSYKHAAYTWYTHTYIYMCVCVCVCVCVGKEFYKTLKAKPTNIRLGWKILKFLMLQKWITGTNMLITLWYTHTRTRATYTHAHTHAHAHIYVCLCVCGQRVL